MTRRQAIARIITASAILVVGAAICWISQGLTRPGGSEISRLSPRCDLGQAHRYSLRYQSSGEADLVLLQGSLPGSGANGAKRVHSGILGEWVERCVGKEGSRRIYSVHLEEVREAVLEISSRTGGAPDARTDLSGEMARPFFVVREPSGKAAHLVFDERQSQESKHTVRDLMRHLQWMDPPGDGNRWQVPEEDVDGKYVATYILEGDRPGRRVLTKTRQYLSRDKTLGEGSATRFDVDEEDRLVRVQSRLELATLMGKQQVARSDTRVDLTWMRMEPAVGDDGDATVATYHAWQASTGLVSLDGRESWERLERDMSRSELDRGTAESVLARLEQAKDKVDGETYKKLKALLTLQPEFAGQLARSLREWDVRSPAFRSALGALVKVGNESAQEALRWTFDACARADSKKRIVLLAHAGLLENPDEKTEAWIRSAMSDGKADEEQHTVAGLALGNVGNALQQTQPERAAQIYRELSGQYQNASTPGERIGTLRALGNLGHPDTPGLLGDSLGDADPEIRRIALAALRFVPGESPDALLVRALREDPEGAVRLEAVLALRLRRIDDPALQSLRAALEKDPSLQVRVAVLESISLLLQDHPELADDLVRAKRGDRSREVRQLAELILAKLGA